MKKTIAIFGGGPSSLALAAFLDPDLFQITIYEQNKTCGRKFLVAGKGGFNLTFSEPIQKLCEKYLPTHFLKEALFHFSNTDLRAWLSDLGIETFVGSSQRVFPVKGIKPIQVLDSILKDIESKGVDIKCEMKWDGWSASGLPLVNRDMEIKADYYVYAFGGASWKVTGSTGQWTEHFKTQGIAIHDFEPSNCAFEVEWSTMLLDMIEGKPLKNIAISCDGSTQKGELVITRFGLEGNAIYALSNPIRNQLQSEGRAKVTIDFKPMFTREDIELKMAKSKFKSSTDFLKKDLNLNKVQIHLIKQLTTKVDFVNKEKLVDFVKNLEIEIQGTALIDEAISTVGGLQIDALTDNFELKKMRNSFCIGEMVDWDAPTGGYLLQGCLSMGVFLAAQLNRKEK